jgi:hypothetical protein
MESRPGCGTVAEGARTQAVIPPTPTERQYALRRRPLAVAAVAAGSIRCAGAIRDSVRSLNLGVRCGLHTGECELLGNDLAGIAVHTGARVAGLAAPGEILVSQTVRDPKPNTGKHSDIVFRKSNRCASLFKWSRSKLLLTARAITRTGSAINLRFFQPSLPQHRLVTIFATSPQVRQCRDKSRYKSSCPTPAGRRGPRA